MSKYIKIAFMPTIPAKVIIASIIATLSISIIVLEKEIRW